MEEIIGEPMANIFRALRRIVNDYPDVKALYPIHMNPKVRAVAAEHLADAERIRLVEPMDVLDFHNMMNSSFIILTDSGGIQEEAPSPGKPVLVARTTTERPEGVEAGTLRLVGTNESALFHAMSTLLSNTDEYDAMSEANNPYGDGFASQRIADILGSGI